MLVWSFLYENPSGPQLSATTVWPSALNDAKLFVPSGIILDHSNSVPSGDGLLLGSTAFLSETGPT